jgi:hypothetical protein
MPTSKVRNKEKKKIAADRKRLHEQDSPCADSCCPGKAADIAAGMPRLAQARVPGTADRPSPGISGSGSA